MKNKLFYAIGVLLLLGSFVAGSSSKAYAGGNPIPPCPPEGCPILPGH